MKRATLYRWAFLIALIGLLEILCLTGVINKITMQPPHKIATDLYQIVVSGKYNSAILKTFANAATAFLLAMSAGIVIGAILHRARLLREVVNPLFATYYAIPIFAFYPLLIILFGLGDAPQILIGFMLAVVAVIVNVLDGLDRVPRVLLKTARVAGLGPVETVARISLPYASPYLLTGAKLAVAYSLIGVIGAEFIMSRGGMGYEINFAYTNFDNATMYPLIVIILFVSIALNMGLARWEKSLMRKRGLQ
jgi:NitT/TauT family transport system permease protein